MWSSTMRAHCFSLALVSSMSMYLAVVASCQGDFTWFDFHIKSCNNLCRSNCCVEGYFDRASLLSLTINFINISNTIIFSI